MEQNIGLLDRYIRLVSGMVALTASVNQRRNSWPQTALMTFGAMKVAEGVTGWCPVMQACGIQSKQDSSNKFTAGQAKSAADDQSSDKQNTDPQSRTDTRHSRAEVDRSGHSHGDHSVQAAAVAKEPEAAVNSSFQ